MASAAGRRKHWDTFRRLHLPSMTLSNNELDGRNVSMGIIDISRAQDHPCMCGTVAANPGSECLRSSSHVELEYVLIVLNVCHQVLLGSALAWTLNLFVHHGTALLSGS